MKFIDDEHKKFWNEKLDELKKLGKTDVYYKSLVYTLGICETTRSHFDKIFNLREGEINVDSLHGAFQTGTSEKVTRMAFSLWNNCNYDSDVERQEQKVSENYNVSEIFCCSYAPYFYEAIKIRYPEYTEENKHYYMINSEVKNNEFENIGIYVSANSIEDAEKQKSDLIEQISSKEYSNFIIYVDVGKNNDVKKCALDVLKDDITENRIDIIYVRDISKISRKMQEVMEFLNFTNIHNVRVISADGSVEKYGPPQELEDVMNQALMEIDRQEEER